MIADYHDYRQYLKDELAKRVQKNSSYSLRAFAHQLEISPAYLSLILARKKRFSADTASKVAKRLGLKAMDAEYFSLLAQFDLADTDLAKMKVFDQISELNSIRKRTVLANDVFRVISDWYYFAILNLTEIRGFNFATQNVANRLRITRAEADAAIQRLLQLGFLEATESPDKKYRRTKRDLFSESNIPNAAFQKHYKQLFEKAIYSISNQASDDRLLCSETLAISKSQLSEAEELMDEFVGKIVALSKKNVVKTDVFNLSVIFFNLSPRGDV